MGNRYSWSEGFNSFDTRAIGNAINQGIADYKKDQALDIAKSEKAKSVKALDEQFKNGTDGQKMTQEQYNTKLRAIDDTYNNAVGQADVDYYKFRGDEEERAKAEKSLRNAQWAQNMTNFREKAMSGDPEALKRLVAFSNTQLGDGGRYELTDNGTLTQFGADGNVVQSGIKVSPEMVDNSFRSLALYEKFRRDSDLDSYLSGTLDLNREARANAEFAFKRDEAVRDQKNVNARMALDRAKFAHTVKDDNRNYDFRVGEAQRDQKNADARMVLDKTKFAHTIKNDDRNYDFRTGEAERDQKNVDARMALDKTKFAHTVKNDDRNYDFRTGEAERDQKNKEADREARLAVEASKEFDRNESRKRVAISGGGGSGSGSSRTADDPEYVVSSEEIIDPENGMVGTTTQVARKRGSKDIIGVNNPRSGEIEPFTYKEDLRAFGKKYPDAEITIVADPKGVRRTAALLPDGKCVVLVDGKERVINPEEMSGPGDSSPTGSSATGGGRQTHAVYPDAKEARIVQDLYDRRRNK